jgi:hypothetical protein
MAYLNSQGWLQPGKSGAIGGGGYWDVPPWESDGRLTIYLKVVRTESADPWLCKEGGGRWTSGKGAMHGLDKVFQGAYLPAGPSWEGSSSWLGKYLINTSWVW